VKTVINYIKRDNSVGENLVAGQKIMASPALELK
jgi:hypothetical protein